jgi:predicted acylesterase/phospholipase RssA
VGACLSAGRPLEALEAEARALRRSDIAGLQRRGLWMRGLRSPSIFRGEVLARTLGRVLGSTGWEALEIRFQANAVEMGTGRTEWFGIGARTDVALADAIYASSALPVFYPPIELPGGVYVDGGTEDALPIARAAELGATGIVAVDVGAAEVTDPRAVVERGMLAVHERVFSIMSGGRRRRTVANWSGPPLVYIRPELDDVGTLELGEPDRLLEAGRIATERMIGKGAAPAAVP